MSGALSERRLLVVDDDAFTRGIVAGSLRRAGADVTEADSVAAATAALDDGVPFDVIVSDLNMPGANGLDLLRSLPARNINPARVVVVTAFDHDEFGMNELRGLGVNHVLSKPVRAGSLIAIVLEIIEEDEGGVL